MDAYSDWDVHSVTSARVDLRIDDNGTWLDAFQFGEPDDTTWTLQDQSFELDVQLNPYDTIPLLSLSTDNGRIVVDDIVQRVIHFNVPPAEIQEALRSGTYIYDLVMVSNTDIRVPLMHGALYVNRGITFPP